MIKKFCDACGKEKKRLHGISIPCHLWEFRLESGYVDNDGNRTSGRDNHIEVCRRCHNRAMYKCVEELRAIAKENDVQLNEKEQE